MSRYRDGKIDPFAGYDEKDVERVANEIYGTETRETELETGRIIARPISIHEIWPDRKQPRRAVPLAVRGAWDGDPAGVSNVLGNWNQALRGYVPEMNYGGIDVLAILRGSGEGLEYDPDPNPVIDEYRDLLQLAASIYRDGLVNPITLQRQGSRYVIETGERRWLAHHLLSLYIDEKLFGRIAAVVVNRPDVWRQAAENGQRKKLNAIGMARQLALLIMDMYEEVDGASFDSIDDLVLPGEPDRRFYAQVKDGTLYRIPRGMGQRLLDVTGLTSMQTVKYHRALLSIPDDLWVQADAEDWPEFKIRAEVDKIQGTNRAGQQTENEPESGYTVPIGTVSPDESREWAAVTPHRPDPSPDPSPLHGEGNQDDLTTSHDQDDAGLYNSFAADDEDWSLDDYDALESTSAVLSQPAYYDARRLVYGLKSDPAGVLSETQVRAITDLIRLSAEDLRLMVVEDNEDLEWITGMLVERAELVRRLHLEELSNFEQFVVDLHEMAKRMQEKYGGEA